ncbi:MAG: threonylcarbamoyl-AMP synthase [Micrococcales bacterium]|nr:MAG: threonylcarbamoyl-AMP synthase [Micrococcales bacterium]PIE27666.1 MAG: threonylcarbamoyl-AMP synthase [Micrococcales bacterium]
MYDCRSEDGLRHGVRMAAAAVAGGELVVLPTDTVYGIGADAFSPEAVERLLAAKGRGRTMPPPVLVASPAMMAALAQPLPDWVLALTEAYWPGGLTLVVAAQPSLYWDLGETSGTVALRIPDHPAAQDLIRATGPLAVSSANLTGYPTGTTAAETRKQLGESVSIYLEAGELPVGTASTVVDATGEEPVVLRAGHLTEAEVRATAGFAAR